MPREQWEIRWKDHYRTLGVNMAAEPEVLKAAYTALARKHHPDAGGGTDRMKAINEAYEVLSDPLQKARYDVSYRRRRESSQPEPDPGQAKDFTEGRDRTSPTAPASVNGFPILPWLSLGWQRAALATSFPVALIFLFIVPSPVGVGVGAAILVAASYACIKTRFLKRGGQAGIVARLAGGFAIICTLCAMGMAAFTAAVLLVVFVVLSLGVIKAAHKCRRAS
ncbi:MAG: DnaJ domain-containing protein [Chloroflexota bacterium]|nr:DnaJ domain-containing protein [Chloroflexota bacterium]